MEPILIKKLMAEEIIDFPKLVLKNYKKIGLSEIEAFVIIELYNQVQVGNTFLNPSKIIKNITIDKDQLLTILDGLIKRQYLSIQLKKTKSGKETEVFHLDGTIQKIIDQYQIQIKHELISADKEYDTVEEELVDVIETHFQKQLTPLELEIISKWVHEDQFPLLDIKKGLLDAVKANKLSLSYVDSMLIKRKNKKTKTEADVTYNPEKSEALKTFFNSWEKGND